MINSYCIHMNFWTLLNFGVKYNFQFPIRLYIHIEVHQSQKFISSSLGLGYNGTFEIKIIQDSVPKMFI